MRIYIYFILYLLCAKLTSVNQSLKCFPDSLFLSWALGLPCPGLKHSLPPQWFKALSHTEALQVPTDRLIFDMTVYKNQINGHPPGLVSTTEKTHAYVIVIGQQSCCRSQSTEAKDRDRAHHCTYWRGEDCTEQPPGDGCDSTHELCDSGTTSSCYTGTGQFASVPFLTGYQRRLLSTWSWKQILLVSLSLSQLTVGQATAAKFARSSQQGHSSTAGRSSTKTHSSACHVHSIKVVEWPHKNCRAAHQELQFNNLILQKI